MKRIRNRQNGNSGNPIFYDMDCSSLLLQQSLQGCLYIVTHRVFSGAKTVLQDSIPIHKKLLEIPIDPSGEVLILSFCEIRK